MSRDCQIVWKAEDVQTLATSWTLEKCQEWLDSNGKHIVDRSVELGWEVMGDLLVSDN